VVEFAVSVWFILRRSQESGIGIQENICHKETAGREEFYPRIFAEGFLILFVSGIIYELE